MTDPEKLEYEPRKPASPRTTSRFDVDFWAYILPMGLFLGVTQIGVTWEWLYVHSYVVKTLIVPVALFMLWKKYTPVRWNDWWLGIAVGVIGIFQWVGMQLFLQQFELFKPSPDAFNPRAHFAESPVMLYAFLTVRIFGAVLVVPVMEELFWRDFLWRSIQAPNDFKLAQVGEWEWTAFLGVSAAFALVHGNWWATSIVWAMMIGLLLVHTRSLGACIIAHAVTNLLLAIYVLYTEQWFFW